MLKSEDNPESSLGHSGIESNAAKNQDFLSRLDRAESKAVLRGTVWATLLIATGLVLFSFSVHQAQKATIAAEQSERNAYLYNEQAHEYQVQIQQLKTALSDSREAVQYVSMGINLFHGGNYRGAVQAYDNALRLDPKNPYILNLKGYSLFKKKDFAGAISALKDSTNSEPEYAWGYFDLARAYCAQGEFNLAKNGLNEALRLRPELQQVVNRDGEFQRLCKPVISTFP